LIGRDVTGAGEVLIAANRDEDPARPSNPPGILLDAPRLVGGRDRISGGTWLAVRTDRSGRGDGCSVTLLLNRRPLPGAPLPARSRGLLTIDVARAENPRAVARAEAESGRYAPCTLVHVSHAECWWLAITADGLVRTAEIAPGWHAITHAEMDDPGEPRTAWLARELSNFRPSGLEPALVRLGSLLAHHGDASSPAVCLHEGRMQTVSAALLALTHARAIYRHAEGRPCTQPFADVSDRLAGGATDDEAP
jgi:hypothetical protein